MLERVCPTCRQRLRIRLRGTANHNRVITCPRCSTSFSVGAISRRAGKATGQGKRPALPGWRFSIAALLIVGAAVAGLATVRRSTANVADTSRQFTAPTAIAVRGPQRPSRIESELADRTPEAPAPTFTGSSDSPVDAEFSRNIEPLLTMYCVRCHGPEIVDANLRLDQLSPDMLNGPDAETWHDVLVQLNLGEMPPADEPAMSASDHKRLVGWITNEIDQAATHQHSTGGQVVMRRLTRYEYINTMRDLLGVNMDFGKFLPPAPPAADHFVNQGALQQLSSSQLERYLQTARDALEQVIVTGPEPDVFYTRGRFRSKYPVAPGSSFLLKVRDFPTEGEFRIKLTASAVIPRGADYPRLRVTVGFKSGPNTVEKAVGNSLDFRTSGESESLVFRGRMEEYPQPNGGKFPSLLVQVWNDVDDGKVSTPSVGRGRVSTRIIPELDATRPSLMIESASFESPVIDEWPPIHHSRILFPREQSETESAYARRIVERFMERAFRRPPLLDQVDTAVAFFKTIRRDEPSLEDAIRETLAMVLITPDFLYLVEPADSNGKRPLDDYEIASRLSYFLWSTMPDQELLDQAASRTLHEPDVLQKQVERMLADSRSWAFVENFASQWLDLTGVDRVAINPEYFPDFDESLKQDMREETLRFFAEILRSDLSMLNLIDSDFAILNKRLATHYGVEPPRGGDFERVSLRPQDRRGGLLTQGSILLSNSDGGNSHPIRRGVWLKSRLLGDPPPPPPPDVPELNPEEPDLAGLTIQQQLEVHRRKAACNNCHRQIDPWGVAFEEYGAVGNWRDTVFHPNSESDAISVDPIVDLPRESNVHGMAGLKAYLLKHERDRFAETIVRKLLSYGLGRSLEFGDQNTVERLKRNFAANGFRLRFLMKAIVTSEVFLMR